ncbi:hypothetical protein GCM10007907_09760 [Chitinimonas prasina]|uniref:Uncharacterized protein n=1 Tax=Chitinimonas prasina TaxID=1434937 RepID=A0ABQ5YB61_9NEIS|nr:hypothetical protein GCM10007907_09760 [Chitinimonas prasina]
MGATPLWVWRDVAGYQPSAAKATNLAVLLGILEESGFEPCGTRNGSLAASGGGGQ